jgi:hypothetical protein
MRVVLFDAAAAGLLRRTSFLSLLCDARFNSMLKKVASLSCSFGLFGLPGLFA